MRILVLLIFVINMYSCSEQMQGNVINVVRDVQDSLVDDLNYNIKIPTFSKDSIEVVFRNTRVVPTSEQIKLLEQIQKKQNDLYKEILTGVFNYYKRVRKEYKNGVDYGEQSAETKLTKEELESILPTPKSKEYLKQFYKIAVIYIPEKVDWINPEFTIEYYCDWDIENGMVSIIKNWKVQKVETAEMEF